MKQALFLIAVCLFIGLLWVTFGSVSSTAYGSRATAIQSASSTNPTEITTPGSGKIDETAAQQIQSLLEEKESRTPAQQKIDSQLLYAIKTHRGESISSRVQKLTVNVGVDEDGKVTADITAIIDDKLLTALREMKVEIVSSFPQYHALRVIASLDQLETIAAFPQVRFIQPRQEGLYSQAPAGTQQPAEAQLPPYPPTLSAGWKSRSGNLTSRAQVREFLPQAINRVLGIGSVTSQGDTTHRANIARGTFNTDGTGVKIGVLSDGVTSLATSQGTGDLGPVTVLAGQEGSGDEGTAILEVIHDLAPGAQLYFATAGNGLPSFAQNIRDLRTAGCDIILDDIAYFVESPFQDGQATSVVSTNNAGLATQAVNDVVASGALYFSSAGNSGNLNDATSGTWEGDFVDGGPLGAFMLGGNVHDFDPGPSILQFDLITSVGFLINLHWSDPLGGSNNDYDLFLLDTSGSVFTASTNIQNGTQDPYEAIPFSRLGYRVVIVQKTGAANRFLHLDMNRGGLAASTLGETHGHNAASGAYGVAATCALCVFPSAFSNSDQVETFSSDGPRHIFFNGNGTPITPGNVSASGGLVLQKPDITAADGAAVSGAGGFPSVFFGTSAAAPHAAAIAALLKAASPSLTSAQIRTALTSTAIDIEGPGTDRDSGAGIVMPYPALQSLGAPVVGKAFLDFSTVSKTETCCNADGFIDPAESGAVSITLKNEGLLSATAVNATLTTSTAGVTIVNGSSAYPTLASNGSGANTTPLTFSLDPAMSPDPVVDFTLTVNYAGGHQPSQSWNFKLQLGRQLIVNGSFEEGDFLGWTTSTVSTTGGGGSPLQPWTVSTRGDGGFLGYGITQTLPQHGKYDVWNGFDGAGPMEYRMYQDIAIPTGASLTLSWRDRAQWNFCCRQSQQRTYQVQLRDPATNDILAVLYSFSTGVENGYHDTGWLTHSNDISAFAGHTVRVMFLESVPEYFTGPGQLEIDSITSSNNPLPPPTPTPTPGPVVDTLYGTTETGQLFKVNLSTGAGTPAAALPAFGTAEIEFNNTTRRGFTQLPYGNEAHEFDIETGEVLGFIILDGAAFTGLEWVGPTLYGASANESRSGSSELRTIDPSTGASTLIGATGIANPISGLAYDTTSSTMYGLTEDVSGGGPSNLVTVNLTTGAATMIGAVGFNGSSLEFGPDGNLYGVSTGNSGNLYRINKATGASTLVGVTGFAHVAGLTLVNAPVIPANTVQFTASAATVTETLDATTKVDLLVTRNGDTSAAGSVDYTTADGTASERSDYLASLGTLHFAANETSKTVTVFIVDDRLGENAETFNVTLSNATGCTLASPSSVSVTINSNEAVNGANPVKEPGFNTDFFVRQHYIDFLNREPDASGLAFWKTQIDECLSPECRELRKINVSAAFFLSIEFQETGYLVYKTNQAAFNSQEFLKLRDFLADSQEISRGVVIGQPDAAALLEANKQKFFLDFVSRPKFREPTAFPKSLTADQFVDKLLANTFDPNAAVSGSALTPAQRTALISQLQPDPTSVTVRAQVLRAVAENAVFSSRQKNKAFVLMQYFGYLRRDPNDAPEFGRDFSGYKFWLSKLNQFNGNFVNAELVKAFIISGEYGQRFGP
ncbi:MAG TPA: Calx-beta domain-containing protein [Pyrinomonadaceae bacterium]|nr:Calx-beta domain-containing protein [Pyrinomonadaceae bacterium]